MRRVLLMLVLWELAGTRLGAGDFEFAVIGDTRPRFESESFRPFETLIAKINMSRPGLVVNLGDLIYGYGPARKERQWDKYQRVIKTIQVPYFQVPGNHDTHSKEARKIYGRRFGKFYQSFDYADCHFVLLDNTEEQKWGYVGPTQLDWLRRDLHETRARHVFVFLHFPIWEPERITPEYYQFWARTLHPLFRECRVEAVFAGHYHTYGPTREFDGIRYFITGGGGAELWPEFRKSGGDYHFMKVKVSADSFDVRVVTERGELTDPEADLMGGVQFAAANVSRIGIRRDAQDLQAGIKFRVSVRNPYSAALKGQAEWVLDASAFSVEPGKVTLEVPAGATRQYDFLLKALRQTEVLASLPRLEFDAVSGYRRHRFRREVRFLQSLLTPERAATRVTATELVIWDNAPLLRLGEGAQAQLRSCYDTENLYLNLNLPAIDAAEAKESGFSDELQLGFARRLSETDFGRDLLRLGFDSKTDRVWDRTPGHKSGATIPGAKSLARSAEGRTSYEIAIPLRLLRDFKLGPGSRLVVDLSFALPESGPEAPQGLEPGGNTFSYRVRYGSDSLVPVYFVELHLQP